MRDHPMIYMEPLKIKRGWHDAGALGFYQVNSDMKAKLDAGLRGFTAREVGTEGQSLGLGFSWGRNASEAAQAARALWPGLARIIRATKPKGGNHAKA